MLSYQHAYHAGNLADVQKHALLAWVLDYLVQKDKAFSYIETHAGRGVYDLGGDEAGKTGEAAGGIAVAEPWFAADHPYRQRLNEIRFQLGPMAYPGSPMIAAMTMRERDTIHLCELHPQEFEVLKEHLTPWEAHLYKADGWAQAQALCPPTPRRGLMLIDPSYEVKADYDAIPRMIGQLHRKWNVGTIMLWYPILTEAPHGPMLAALMAAHPEALRSEVRFGPARPGHRMVGSGMFVLNAPYGMAEQAAWLQGRFGLL